MVEPRVGNACCAALVLAMSLSACASGNALFGDDGGDDGSGSGSSSGTGSSTSGSTSSTTSSSTSSSGTSSSGISSGSSGASSGISSGGDDGATGDDAAESGVEDSTTDTFMGTGGDDAPNEVSSGGGGDGASTTGLSVSYQVGPSSATSAYIGSELQITNNTAPPTDVSSLKLRYYYTDEVKMTLQMTIQWSHISISGPDMGLTVTSTFGTVTPAAATADSYVEFSFSSSNHPSLAMGESAVFSWQMQGPNPAQDMYTQTNDYSFDASKSTLTSWSHVVLLQGGSVIWGATP